MFVPKWNPMVVMVATSCDPQNAEDVDVAGCDSWCTPRKSQCAWCKCQACSFCTHADHVYLSAGTGIVSCDDGFEQMANLTGMRDKASCQKECDGTSSCRAFTYYPANSSCHLYHTEPRHFCSEPGASTSWRVDVPASHVPEPQQAHQSQTPQTPQMPQMPQAPQTPQTPQAPQAPQSQPQSQPQRILVHGEHLIDSSSGATVQLHGVNVWLDYLRDDDMALMEALIPNANLVRLVGVHWHDSHDCPCCTDDESEGYFAPHCLESLR